MGGGTEMAAPLTIFFMIPYVLLGFLGIMANGFIVGILGRKWFRYHRLSPSDMIMISLGVSRFFLQWVGMSHNFYHFFYQVQYSSGPARQYFGIYWDFLNSTTFWFSTWLSVLFCVKIADFTHPIFLWLKWRVKELVPWLLLASLLMAFTVAMLFFMGNNDLYQACFQGTLSENITFYSFRRKLEIQFFLPLKLITLSIPCSIFVISTVLLIISLKRHSWKMKGSVHSTQNPSTQAHTKALKSLVSFLFLYALSYLSLALESTGFASWESIWFWPWQIVIYLCTCIHPFILILGNSQLGEAFMKFLLLPKTFWNGEGTTSSS